MHVDTSDIGVLPPVTAGGGPAHDVSAAPRPTSPPLRRILVIADLVVIATGWAVASLVASALRFESLAGSTVVLAELAVVLGAGGLLMSANGLYRRRICAVRSQEITRAIRVSLCLGGFAWALLVSDGVASSAAATAAVVGTGTWAGLLAVERGLLREWIQSRRAGGDFSAAVVVVGGSEGSTERLSAFLEEHPVLGFDVRGRIGPWSSPGADRPSALDADDAEALVSEMLQLGATGAVLDANSLTGDQLNDLVRELSGRNLHAHVSSGLSGIDRRRITVSPLADETFLHVAPLALNRRQVVTKRLLDVSLGWLTLLPALPVLILAAAAIWLTDRGPIFFRQRRVGFQGEEFTLYKLRTMVVDADARRADLLADNGRAGPLFKVAGDPRVTPVGRFLRATSLDELPQLFNIIEGTMSLVGPRPALPDEVVQFDPRLQRRLTVKPGLTGLWQVEARDLPSFDLYRRYDLLYIQNWSLLLDLSILARTVTVVASRAARALIRPFTRRGRRGSVLE